MIDSLLDHFAGTSAIWNSVAIPGRSLGTALSRHTFNVFVANDDEKYSVLLQGSGTAIRYNGQHVLVCTQHQLGNSDRQNVGMMVEDGRNLVTSGGMRHYNRSQDTDAHDLVAFNFNEPIKAYPELRARFFNLSRRRPTNNKVIGVLLVGCPTADQLYDVYENNHIGLARRAVLCTPDPVEPADGATLCVVPQEPLSIDPDGMSGGSAFLVHAGSAGFEVDFGGIIVRGGSRRFTVIKAGIVLNFLENVTAVW